MQRYFEAGQLWRLSACDLARLLTERSVSARESVEAHLERIAAIEPARAAFITVAADAARERAAMLDREPSAVGPLHGVPVAIKDLTDTKNLRTTYGSALFSSHVPEADDLVVERLLRAGAVVVGKTNTPEFGFGAVCVNALAGPTRNPFNAELTSGGSSGGSAVAVATGMAALAHGTDFGGSVRTPASFCGVASIRPTPGLVPSPRRALGWDTLATHGVIARSVDDCALMLRVMAGFDARDPTALRLTTTQIITDTLRPRIGATADFGVAPVATDVRELFDDAVSAIERGGESVVRGAPDCSGAIAAFRTLRAAQVSFQHRQLRAAHDGRLTPTLLWNIAQGDGITAAEYLAAEASRTALYRRFASYFEDIDVLIAPAASVLPWPNTLGEVTHIDGVALDSIVDYLAVTFIVSLVGFPVLTLPAGVSRTGLPFGIQLIARPGEEATLLALGRAFERDLGFIHRWPRDSQPQSADIQEIEQ